MSKDYNFELTPPNQQRRAKYAQSDEWTAEFLGKTQVGHVATHWDDQPFITPTLFWYDPDKKSIYFHSNITGRLRANIERHTEVCFETFNSGRLLPSNVALEFSLQYESVVVFGKLRIVDEQAEQKYALYGLLRKYFPEMQPGKEYRPIIDEELMRTSVYAIQVESWSGKRNWKEQADQSADWPALK
ncbi:MAG: NimA [Chloroflexi bacterium RBG_16_54_18]|nr:MAG: NimA [Chloroflexi bacterium RBG_16_54_18]